MTMRRTMLAAMAVTLGLGAGLPAHAAEGWATVNPPHLQDTTRFGYSLATVVEANTTLVFVAGQVGVSEDGPNDYRAQVDRAFDNLVAVLEAAGASVNDVVKITVLIKDHDAERLQYLVEKRRAVFGDNPPASTLIPVEELALESFEFEIDAVAVIRR